MTTPISKNKIVILKFKFRSQIMNPLRYIDFILKILFRNLHVKTNLVKLKYSIIVGYGYEIKQIKCIDWIIIYIIETFEVKTIWVRGFND